jgi:hypothetical protein
MLPIHKEEPSECKFIRLILFVQRKDQEELIAGIQIDLDDVPKTFQEYLILPDGSCITELSCIECNQILKLFIGIRLF